MISFKKAALNILKDSSEPLSAKEITELALERGLIKTEGKTPEASMAAQIYVDINKNKSSPFLKIGRGKFSLKSKTDSTTSPLFLIEKQNELVKKTLKERLLNMDPFLFEHLVADLLQEIGYEEVQVTKISGDGGIDVNAVLTVGGLANVKTVVQVKRFKNNVAGKIITQLRGSAEVDQRGLVITTSDFTKDAIKESKAANKMPVSLVNGEKLISLLLKYGIGVKKETKDIYSIDLDYFENDESILSVRKTSEKNRSLWPLPGGINKYVETLNLILEQVFRNQYSKRELISWFMKTFEKVNSEKTSQGYIFVPKSMGLIYQTNDIYKLTDEGKRYLEKKDLNLLYETISNNIIAFDDIVEFLRNSKAPQKEQDILDYIRENFNIDWTTFAQVNYRLLWLLNLKKIKKTDDGYVLV